MVRDLYIPVVVSVLIWMSHKGICGWAGFSAVTAVFLVITACMLSQKWLVVEGNGPLVIRGNYLSLVYTGCI